MFEIDVLFVLLLSSSMQHLLLILIGVMLFRGASTSFTFASFAFFLHCLLNCTSYPQHPFVTIVICKLVKQDTIEKMSHDAKKNSK